MSLGNHCARTRLSFATGRLRRGPIVKCLAETLEVRGEMFVCPYCRHLLNRSSRAVNSRKRKTIASCEGGCYALFIFGFVARYAFFSLETDCRESRN